MIVYFAVVTNIPCIHSHVFLGDDVSLVATYSVLENWFYLCTWNFSKLCDRLVCATAQLALTVRSGGISIP
jgi:hypothetical protein